MVMSLWPRFFGPPCVVMRLLLAYGLWATFHAAEGLK